MKNYNFFFINSLFNICHLSTKLRLSENIFITKKSLVEKDGRVDKSPVQIWCKIEFYVEYYVPSLTF